MERLHKYLARAGVASRRRAEELISKGLVKVNGKIVSEMGYKVDPLQDVIEYSNELVKQEDKRVYIMINKPQKVMTTLKDPQGRQIISDLLQGISQRLYPVGRLDYMTEGLLILTNDGDLAYRLTHPRYKVDKKYIAHVEGDVTPGGLKLLRQGVQLEDGPTMPADVKILSAHEGATTLQITIHEGRNRQVRRMCQAIGHPVTALKRLSFGPLNLGDLRPGQYRYLGLEEVRALKKACGLLIKGKNA